MPTNLPAPPDCPTSHLRIHQYTALRAGVRLVVLGAVHGNETCGSRAIARLVDELDRGVLTLARGHLSLVPITNPLAYQRMQRNGERNLNRNLCLTEADAAHDNEARIANVLCPLLAAHDALLDLHSFQAQGQPFAMMGPANNSATLEPFSHAAAEEALVLRLGPRRIVEGWLATYEQGVRERLARTPEEQRAGLSSTNPSYGIGTTEYMRSQGGYAITLECGNHADPAAEQVAYQAIRNTLAHLGLVAEAAPEPSQDVEFLRLSKVVDRLHADDTFAKSWSSFDRVQAGEHIGTRHDGTAVLADQDGYIVFPNTNATVGNEWFYFAQPSERRLRG